MKGNSTGIVRRKTERIPMRPGGFPQLDDRTGEELKFVDVNSQFSATLNTTGGVVCLNMLAQGTDFNERVGRVFHPRSIHIRGFVGPEDATTNPSYCRIAIVWDACPNGALAAVGDIFTLDGADGLAGNLMGGSFPQVANRHRFKILSDQSFAFPGTDAVMPKGPVYLIDKYVRLPAGSTTTCKGTAADIASIASGAILVVLWGSEAAGSGPRAYIGTRVRFTDA
jgi:hypothetical protein